MKTYTIKNTDIMHNGKIYPEGIIINLEDEEALKLSNYLDEIKDSSIITTNVTLSKVEKTSLNIIKEQSTKNKIKDKK